MYSKRTVIQNECGLHARPAALFCKKAATFKSSITIANCSRGECEGKNAKSILSILVLCAGIGTEVEIVANGPDEQLAVETLVALIDSGLGEKVSAPVNQYTANA